MIPPACHPPTHPLACVCCAVARGPVHGLVSRVFTRLCLVAWPVADLTQNVTVNGLAYQLELYDTMGVVSPLSCTVSSCRALGVLAVRRFRRSSTRPWLPLPSARHATDRCWAADADAVACFPTTDRAANVFERSVHDGWMGPRLLCRERKKVRVANQAPPRVEGWLGCAALRVRERVRL